MNITVLYVGSSLLAPLKNAEREINRVHKLGLRVAAYNFGSPLSDREWLDVESDLKDANVVFVIHVMDGENATRLVAALEKYQTHDAVIVINCMPELMRRTRMGRLDISTLGKGQNGKGGKLLKSVGSWVGNTGETRQVEPWTRSVSETGRSPAGNSQVCADRRRTH